MISAQRKQEQSNDDDEKLPLSKELIAKLKPKIDDDTGRVKPAHVFDGGEKHPAVAGLLVRCQPSGKKYFYYQFRRPAFVKNRKTGEEALNKNASTRICLGLVDDLTISKAREKARTARDAARAARRAELTGDNVVHKVHEALNNLDESVDVLEARQEAKRICLTVERFIDDEYAEFKKTEGWKVYQGGREIQRLKHTLSVLSRPAKKGRKANTKVHPDLNLLTKKLDEIDNALIRKWKTARLQRASDQTGKPPSRVTVERELMVMRAMFTEAVAREYINSNPLIDKHPKKGKKKKIKSKNREGLLTQEQERRLLQALVDRENRLRKQRRAANEFARKEGGRPREDFPDDKFVDFLHPMVIIAMHTGLRYGEIASLKWGDVSFTNDESGEGQNQLAIWDTKNDEPLSMPLNKVAVQAFRKWQRWPGKSVASIDQEALVFTDRKGNRLVDIRRFWKPVFLHAGLPKGYRFHDLRHHFASKLVSMGKPLFAVQVLLNHSNPKMTERYAKHAPEFLESVVDALAEDDEWSS